MIEETPRHLRDAVRRLVVTHRALADAKRPCGAPLSMPHAYALLELLHSEEPLTVSALAETLAIDRTNVSRLCSRMEETGELIRRAHPRDGRARALHLTPHGEALARNTEASSTQYFTRLFHALGTDADAVIRSLALLQKIMKEEL